MNIGIIFYGTYPFNRGVDQIAQSIKEIGHNPMIVAKKPKNGKIRKEFNGIKVIQIQKGNNKEPNILEIYHYPFNPFWRKILIHLGKKEKWKAIIVRESPLAWPVISAAKSLGIPAYLDMRENLAAMYRNGKTKNLFLWVLRQSILIKIYEKLNLKKFRTIFTVSPELRYWLVRSYGLLPESVTVLENTPHKKYLEAAENALRSYNSQDDQIRMVYSGTVKESKGIGDIVGSLRLILDKAPNVRLRVIGDGQDLNWLKKMVRGLKLQAYVEFYPMLSLPDLAQNLALCDIGVESCWLNKLTNQTLPGKLFEYMAVGLPILSSARVPVIRIIKEVGCGRIYQSRSPEDISRTALSLIENKSLRRELGQRGRQAVLKRYNWKSNLNTLKKALDT